MSGKPGHRVMESGTKSVTIGAGYCARTKHKASLLARTRAFHLVFAMPVASPRPCRHPGCTILVRDGTGLCDRHQSDRKIGTFADPHRGSRQSRGYGADWDKRRLRVLRRDKGLCQECLRQSRYRPARIVDHIVPKFEGGRDDEDNLQSLCQACSDAKTASESARARRRGQ